MEPSITGPVGDCQLFALDASHMWVRP